MKYAVTVKRVATDDRVDTYTYISHCDETHLARDVQSIANADLQTCEFLRFWPVKRLEIQMLSVARGSQRKNFVFDVQDGKAVMRMFERLLANAQRPGAKTEPRGVVCNETRQGSYLSIREGLAAGTWFIGIGRPYPEDRAPEGVDNRWVPLLEKVG